MKLLLVIVVFGGLALIDLPNLLRKKQWPALITYSIIFSIGFLLSSLQVLGAKIPNPNKGIEALIKLIVP